MRNLQPSEDPVAVARRNCRQKCAEMFKNGSLTNHKTGFNALRNLDDVHRQNLTYMGFNFAWTFSLDKDNGVFRRLVCGILFTTSPL